MSSPVSRRPSPEKPARLQDRIRRFFSDEAWLSLFTLLVLLGLVVGLQQFAKKVATPTLAPPGERKGRGIDAGASAAPDACGQIVVQLAEAGTLRQLVALLRQFDATVIYGPDENGAFALRASDVGGAVDAAAAGRRRDARAVAIATAMEKSDLIVTANARECK
ncbi:MAG: hypothetical protein JWQ88_2309 [Rhodoferax sp.]|nr:hypothetical protein [Rhodoferax sp.]